jgi:hypothetical protein
MSAQVFLSSAFRQISRLRSSRTFFISENALTQPLLAPSQGIDTMAHVFSTAQPLSCSLVLISTEVLRSNPFGHISTFKSSTKLSNSENVKSGSPKESRVAESHNIRNTGKHSHSDVKISLMFVSSTAVPAHSDAKSSFFLVSSDSLSKSFMSISEKVLTHSYISPFSLNSFSEIIFHTNAPITCDLPISVNLACSSLPSFSLSIPETLFPLFTKIDVNEPFPSSPHKLSTDLSGSSAIDFCKTCSSDHFLSSDSLNGSERRNWVLDVGAKEATVGTIAPSIGGTIGGLLLAVIATATLAIVVGRRREVVEEKESGADIEEIDTRSSFEPSDDFAILENTDQVRTEPLICLWRPLE